MVFPKSSSGFFEMSNSLCNVYQFKSFKKNLKFKKSNRGITKFVKNRKKYFLRKRRTNYLIYYTYFYEWGKLYMLYRQLIRYSQFLSIGSLGFSSKKLTYDYMISNLFKKKLNATDFKFLNVATISKKIFLNKTFFEKVDYKFSKIFFNNNYFVLFYTNFTNYNLFNKNVFEFFFWKKHLFFSRENTQLDKNLSLTQLVVYKSLVDSIFYKSILLINFYRRLVILLILNQY